MPGAPCVLPHFHFFLHTSDAYADPIHLSIVALFCARASPLGLVPLFLAWLRTCLPVLTPPPYTTPTVWSMQCHPRQAWHPLGPCFCTIPCLPTPLLFHFLSWVPCVLCQSAFLCGPVPSIPICSNLLLLLRFLCIDRYRLTREPSPCPSWLLSVFCPCPVNQSPLMFRQPERNASHVPH